MDLATSFVWTVKERDPRTGLFVPTLSRKNLQTTYGLTAYASALQGGYQFNNPPIYLAIDTYKAPLSAAVAVGATSVSTTTAAHLTGQVSGALWLGLGTANSEKVAFSAVSGAGPYTYTIAAATKTHASGDPVVRDPTASDTVTALRAEAQYDAVSFPNKRMNSNGGYSQGNANWTMQFFFTGTQATGLTFYTLGLLDSANLAGGNLHNVVVLGYAHTSGNDVEIDVSLTLSNL